jgi:hypothetical protein
VEQSRIYPLKGKKSDAKAMKFPDASGVPANMLPVSDGSVFNDLKRLVDSEDANLAHSDSLGMLASIGIVKGQPFKPDARTRAILDRAAQTAYKMSRVIGFEDKVNGLDLHVYPDRSCWLNPFADGTPKNLGGAKDLAWRNVAGAYPYLDLDARIWMFTDYYSLSPGMLSQSPGKGAKYMIAFNDSKGAPLSGGSHYRLKLPADIPAAMFWSVTLYEAENASGLANGQPFPSLGSKDLPAQNSDGSTDLYLGPKAPKGQADNWLATVPGKGYFVILRLYGPTKAAINKSWKPGNVDKLK